MFVSKKREVAATTRLFSRASLAMALNRRQRPRAVCGPVDAKSEQEAADADAIAIGERRWTIDCALIHDRAVLASEIFEQRLCA